VIDYHSNCVALSEFITKLSAANFADAATTQAKKRALDAVGAQGGGALLGAFVYHLIGHAASDGAEISLMERAAGLWARGINVLSHLGAIRTDLEAALENPSDPGSVDRFNQAILQAQIFRNSCLGMQTEIDALRSDVMKFPHLRPHPRQGDQDTDSWDWGNRVLARRTDALVRSLFRHSSNSMTLAFATGAASSYGANVTISTYLGQVVGGPRRAHRHRDRIARNAVGAWFAAHNSAAVTPGTMAQRITFGSPAQPALPPELDALLRDALTDTFDLGRTQPLPDLQLGYSRLVNHLKLLDDFVLPQYPAMPSQVWVAAQYEDTQNPPGSLRPQDVDVTGQDGGGVAATYGPASAGSNSSDPSDSSKTAKGCGIALFLIIVVDLVQALVQCLVQWGNGHTCTFWENMLLEKLWEQDPPDPTDPQQQHTTTSQLTAMSSSPQVESWIWQLFETHNFGWELMSSSQVWLAIAGLIYPTPFIKNPPYKELTLAEVKPWPHREELDPTNYQFYPSSPLENPTAMLSPFPGGALPDVPLSKNELNASAFSLSLWRQIVAGQHDSQNRDLDADRGYGHLCWATRGSIRADPVDVKILGYDEQ
jgi:hypothetical protein